MTWVLDLDGVVWLAGRPLPGATEAIETLMARGEQVAFVTNNSGPTISEHMDALRRVGINAWPEMLITSAQAAASLFKKADRVAVIGGRGISEALVDNEIRLVDISDEPSAVVVGRTTELDYEKLAVASEVIRSGARFVATNTDATFPTDNGLEPGAGCIVAYLATASGVEPEVAGKPHRPMVELLKSHFGSASLVIGDRPETDGLLATELEIPFALVLSGVTKQEHLPVVPNPAVIGEDLADVVAQWGYN